MKHFFIIVPLLLSSACSSVAVKQTALHDFGVMSVGVETNNNTPLKKAEIEITTPPWLADNCIHYRLLYKTPTQLSCYNLDKWLAPPADLFKQQLLASGRFANQRLMIQLLDFEQQFDSPKQTRVVLHFTVDVYALDAERLLATHDFRLAQAAVTPDAIGAVTSFSQLVQQANGKLEQWLITIKSPYSH